MSDPLSIAASVAGLITLAGTMYNSVSSFIDRVESTPRFVQTMLMELSIMRMALGAMSNLIDKFSELSPARMAMVHLDCLIMTVSNAVMTFSDLEVFLSGWPAISRISSSPLQKIRWSLQDDKAQGLITRMRDARDGLSLVLNIFQSESDFGAMQARDTLQLTVNRLLQENRQLRAYLVRDGNVEDTGSILSEDAFSQPSRTESLVSQSRRTSLLLRRPFETILNSTRVYTRVKSDVCDRSFITDLVSSHNGSAYTGLTLDHISIISVIALPLPWSRVINKKWYEPASHEIITKHQIVILGERGAGKSALAVRFCYDAFLDGFDPTIEDTYQKTISTEGKQHGLLIVDTGGNQEFNVVRASSIKAAHGIIIVYPVDKMGEFERIEQIHATLCEIRGQDNLPPVVLVGTRLDEETSRVISRPRGRSLAARLKCGFFESSAKTGENIDDPFLYIVNRSQSKVTEIRDPRLLGWEHE